MVVGWFKQHPVLADGPRFEGLLKEVERKEQGETL